LTNKTAAIPTTPGVLLPGGFSVLKVVLPVVLLAIITFLTYANAWSDTLVVDDKLFVDHQRFSDYSAIPRYFSEDAWAERNLSGGLYRPMLFVSITLDANFFEGWFAGYHLVNVLLHVVLTVLLYAFLARLLEMDDRTAGYSVHIAFLAALVFGVHPMHTEVVNSIFNRSIMLAALGVVTGLWWLLYYLESKPLLAWSGLFLAYLFALFCRETAIVLPGIAAALVLIYSKGNFSRRVRKCLPVLILLIPMVFYLVMRDRALTANEHGPTQSESSFSSVVAQVDSSRLLEGKIILDVAGTWLKALAVMSWPLEPKLSYLESPRYLQLSGFFIHLGLLVLALFLFRRGHKGLLTGLVFFYIALLPSSRLFGAGSHGPHLTERYLYIPSIGLTVLLAYALSYLNGRFDRLLAAAPIVLSLFVLIPVTWARNTDWASEITLFESDYRAGGHTSYLLRLLTAAHLRENNFKRVIEICEEQRAMQKISGMLSTHCASALSYSGRHDEAEQAYLEGTRHEQSRVLAHSNLAQHYMRQGRRDDAKIQFEKAVEVEENPVKKAYYTGIMLVHLYTNDREKLREARTYFEQVLRSEPRNLQAQSWLNRLNQAFGEVPQREQ
jgi:tetratricopeptide (TPR) repeat protein